VYLYKTNVTLVSGNKTRKKKFQNFIIICINNLNTSLCTTTKKKNSFELWINKKKPSFSTSLSKAPGDEASLKKSFRLKFVLLKKNTKFNY
jgi:hypothetical protein